MKKFFLSILFVLLTALPLAAGESPLVKAEGLAARTENSTADKKAALDNALKNAVVQALSELSRKEGVEFAETPEITSNPGTFVQNYRVLSEGVMTHMESVPGLRLNPEQAASPSGTEVYHIWIEASIDMQALKTAAGRSPSAGEDAVTITISGVTDYKAYNSIFSALKGMAVIRELRYGSFSRGSIVLSAYSTVGRDSLAERISKELKEHIVISGRDGLTIKASPRPSLE